MQGRARYQLYQKLLALVFATAQGWGALLYARPFVSDFSTEWLFTSLITLIAGSVILGYVSLSIHPKPSTLLLMGDLTLVDEPVLHRSPCQGRFASQGCSLVVWKQVFLNIAFLSSSEWIAATPRASHDRRYLAQGSVSQQI